MEKPLWEPSDQRIQDSRVHDFCSFVAKRTARRVGDTTELAGWAVENPSAFWDAVWDWAAIIGDKGNVLFDNGQDIATARFFPDAALNFAENILNGATRVPRESLALVAQSEDIIGQRWTWQELSDQVSRLQQGLAAAGVMAGDRVAAILPNRPEAIACMLAAASIGAIWCSASPDYGVEAIVDRFGQIEPKVLIAIDGYQYAGKRIFLKDRLTQIAAALPGLSRIVIIDNLGEAAACCAAVPTAMGFADFTAPFHAAELRYTRLPFDHPLCILFSSGTTGAPKCIVHRAGGVLLQHVKELSLHADVRPGDRVFYYTTLSWMMWNWMASALSQGAALVLYDGSPFHPDAGVLWTMTEREKVTHFGTSAKYIDTLRSQGFALAPTKDLAALRTVLSTGSPLLAPNFAYIYTFKRDLHLASISGGTDIVSCFVGGDPTRPVHAGELQCAGFGMDVQVWRNDGCQAACGERGELVCTAPFPSMPLGFWKDDGARYRSTYFARFPGVWCQGDFAETTASGGFVIHGRSDTTLNPGGVRIGTAEIYAEVAGFPEVSDCVAVSQNLSGDEQILLFVILAAGSRLDDNLVQRIKTRLRLARSPRHVPAAIHAVPALPRTRSGKVSEISVRDAVNGRANANGSSLENPETIAFFEQFYADMSGRGSGG
jgi:acetoacetyl-CoA synthetase